MAKPTISEVTSQIIDLTISIEKIIDEIISFYFCDNLDRSHDFKNLILFHERITLDFKKETIASIVKKENFKDLFKQSKDILTDLSKVPEHRNRFAHLERLTNDDIKIIIDEKTQVWSAVDVDKTVKDLENVFVVFKRYKNGSLKYIGYGEYELYSLTTIQQRVVTFLKSVNEILINEKRKRFNLTAGRNPE